MKTRITLFVAACFMMQSCSSTSEPNEVEPYDILDLPESLPLWKVDKDTARSFELNPKEPFQIEFGRGSSIFGLDSLRILSDGTLTLFRKRIRSQGKNQLDIWQIATLQLEHEEINELIRLIKDNRLLKLERGYHAAVADGSQWILWIKQGDKEKAIYFNNYFPIAIRSFATKLDVMLSQNGTRMINWKPSAEKEGKKQQEQLWKRLP
jgi:hypothetical protein